MNTKSEEIERVWKVAEALDQQMDFLGQELQHAEALMKLPSEKEGSLDSDSECYSYRMPIANVIEPLHLPFSFLKTRCKQIETQNSKTFGDAPSGRSLVETLFSKEINLFVTCFGDLKLNYKCRPQLKCLS